MDSALQVPDMGWIHRISRVSQVEKEGFYRILLPPSLYHRFAVDPLTYGDRQGDKVVRFFCPEKDRTALVEMKFSGMEDPVFSIQLSDTVDNTQIELDFVIVNDPDSPRFNTNVDEQGRDTLFGWAARNIPEEIKAVEAGYFPGQVRRGLKMTREVIRGLDFFCNVLGVKSIRLDALFYHNAITYERCGFSYFEGYGLMKRIHELFQPGKALCEKLDGSTPFRKPEFAESVRGRSWAIHDGVLLEVDDDLLEEGWSSPVMYRMVENPRAMVTFPDPVY
ncbi:MAG: hypothetical protein C4576_06155 [Desulfobacteraceae bacterium]|nr:MAG: hypothetical protein C4576_06155 [Desulfobacteraceae bacterium]